MKQNFTHQLLILHAYNETGKHERETLTKELSKNELLQEEMAAIMKTKRMLNGKTMRPSQTSVRIIMEHSYKTEHLQEI
jgi:hypothetical protein